MLFSEEYILQSPIGPIEDQFQNQETLEHIFHKQKDNRLVEIVEVSEQTLFPKITATYMQRINLVLKKLSSILFWKKDRTMRSYVHLLKELNQRLPEGIELLTLVNYDLGPNGAPIKLLLLNRNHPDKISDLERLVSATGYGKTNEFEYDSEFVFFEQGMGITIDYYSFYKLKNNTITNIKKDLNKEYEKMEILLRIYEFKMI